jgi:uncharacterized protein YbjT (DUF2867 family)
MTDSRLILVIGGTRGTGLLIARLLERAGLPVRVLARDPVRAVLSLGKSVEVVPGDITKQETIPPALAAASHVVFTAGCRSGHPVSEAQVKATEYHGVVNTLAAARGAGFAGRFLYIPLSLRYRIARADVAAAFVAALDHPCATRATFEVVWDRGQRREAWPALLDRVKPDARPFSVPAA